MKPNLSFILLVSASLFFQITSVQAANILWSSSSGSAWLTGSNWTGSAVPTVNDVAQLGANPTGSNGVGINFNNPTNAGVQTTGNRIQELQAIELTSARTSGSPVIGNSSTTTGATGTLRLLGGTVNSVSNVILRNNSSQNLTIQDTQGSGSRTMALSLGNATENKVVIDGSGNIVISNAIISASGTTPLSIMGSGSGRVDVTNAANTFTGGININGGEVRFTTDGSMGNAANDIIIDGGRFATANSANFTLGAGRDVFVGDNAGTSISTPGSGTFTINTGIANKTGETGSWAKQGGGTLELGGESTYTGSTAINNGIVKLTTGNDRLPTGTVVSLGQAASANLGTLDLNGRNQQIAGLNSTAGTNLGSSTNVVTSGSGATLTINTAAATTHTYSVGTTANSGIISGAISFVKEGDGTQVLGGTNTYTGTTTISNGTLQVTGSIGTSDVTVNGGVLASGVTGTVGKDVTVNSGGTLAAGGVGAVGVATVDNNLTFGSGSIFNWDLNANSTDTGFDKVSAAGTIAVSNTNTVFNVIFGTGVDLADAFWTTASPTQSWSMESIFGKALTAGSSFANVTSTANPTTQGSFSITNSTLTWTAVPEPSSALAGLLIAAGLLRRRRVG